MFICSVSFLVKSHEEMMVSLIAGGVLFGVGYRIRVFKTGVGNLDFLGRISSIRAWLKPGSL